MTLCYYHMYTVTTKTVARNSKILRLQSLSPLPHTRSLLKGHSQILAKNAITITLGWSSTVYVL